MNGRRTAALKLSPADRKVLDAFTDGKAAESKKLSTDGKTLDGLWMGGNELAVNSGGTITPGKGRPHVKSDEVVLRALKKLTPKNSWRGASTDEQRVARELVRLAGELMAAIKVREFDDSKGHRWVFDDGTNIGWVKEIEGPGIPLYRILVTVEELGSTFKYKRQIKSQKEAAKIVRGVLKAFAFEGGGGVIMRDWSKVASARRQTRKRP